MSSFVARRRRCRALQAAGTVVVPITTFWLGRLTASGIWTDAIVAALCLTVAVLLLALLWMLARPEAERIYGRKPDCSMTIVGVWDTRQQRTAAKFDKSV